LVVGSVVDEFVDAPHLIEVVVLLSPDLLLAIEAVVKLAIPVSLFPNLGHDFGLVLGLPAIVQLGSPLVADLPVVGDVDRQVRTMETVEALGVLAQGRDDLYGALASADDADPNIAGLLKVAVGEAVVPVRGAERVTLGAFHPVAALLGERAVCTDHEFVAHRVAPVRRDVPPLGVADPQCFGDRGLESSEVVYFVLLYDRLATGEGLWALRIVLWRHAVHLAEQREVVVRNDIAGNAGVAIPQPGAATSSHAGRPDREECHRVVCWRRTCTAFHGLTSVRD
jgi:hypothetical protein